MDDTSFFDVISGSAPRSWVVKRPHGGPWIGVRRRGERLPGVGWKLHVSATPLSAGDVLARALPILLEAGAAFKVAASPAVVAALNEGEGGISQIGKFLTVYPRDEEQAVELAAALDEGTRGLRGPRVETDRELRPGSLVHYRYAAFTGGPQDPEPSAPTSDPFVSAGIAEVQEHRPIAGRYVLVSTLHRSAGGSVHLAADMESGKACVLKRAGRDARTGPDGRDARDHLRHEASVLERLAPDPRFPAVRDLVEEAGDLYLVMEHLIGRTLGSEVTGPCGTERTVDRGRQLASALSAVHGAGLVYRDLDPANVVVGEDGVVRLIDFELACDIGSTGEAAGTPGYCSPQQIAGAPATVADDVYGLGAVLDFLATGADPGAPGTRALEHELERVIARALDENPDARYSSMEELDSALSELEGSS
jgi:hypothetical protein